FTYHFAYQKLAGISHRVGADGPWEPKRVLGTVPVEADGSALFRVPANMPISIQPIDDQGRALQLMRSWTTAMPGEVVSCVGCHEQQNSTPPNQNSLAAKRLPSTIEPWLGPVHGFSFRRDVQPVVDKYCVACHDGSPRKDGRTIPDLRGDQGRFVVLQGGGPAPQIIEGESLEDLLGKYGGVFEPSYFTLRGLIRTGGFESDIRLLNPGEFHVETSELIQMLQKGHHGVELDDEAWNRLFTWIDLNGPCHGTWAETVGEAHTADYRNRRIDLWKTYANIDGDYEAVPPTPAKPIVPVRPKRVAPIKVDVPHVAGWPFDAKEAQRRQSAAGKTSRTIDLGDGVALEMVLVPAGRFVMGDPSGQCDERAVAAVTIDRPFWIGRFEVTNEQYLQFDPDHDSRFEHKGSWSFWERHLGWPLNGPAQPVVRISQQEAEAFCQWLSRKTGGRVTLPTEAQWEYACRGGTAGQFSYGDVDTDFAPFANLADATIRQLAFDTDGRHTADMTPRDDRFDDGQLVTADVGQYEPNAWGLHDMHGNVWEWTRSAYRAYPYVADDGRNDPTAADRHVVRGGSWRDRPERCRSAYRLSYPAWQKVYNVGFRVVCEAKDVPPAVVQAAPTR
ncbi:MAG TPA: SUMF1/EgtB/PvdO family nonheme iron enzyme, partial [Thermoguttaceae bacterium]|nr:SUMF1/EgtB/PvdO family nonheme iron enzyme [Thermoguttaceae bacterium]